MIRDLYFSASDDFSVFIFLFRNLLQVDFCSSLSISLPMACQHKCGLVSITCDFSMPHYLPIVTGHFKVTFRTYFISISSGILAFKSCCSMIGCFIFCFHSTCAVSFLTACAGIILQFVESCPDRIFITRSNELNRFTLLGRAEISR